ncbi:MAG: hypothetical protein LBT59_10465 [Clostridiales bacterium]|jgi:hypothetical protein|nr:hypothetical protein [Clostridiales bacterium]
MSSKLRKGAALPIVIVTFAVITLISGVSYQLFRANLSQIVQQEKNLQAYYNMLSGIEIATGALFTDAINPYYDPSLPYDEKNILTHDVATLIEMFQLKSSAIGPFEHLDIELPTGKVSVKISYDNAKPGSTLEWIHIESDATYTDAAGVEFKQKGNVWYQMANPYLYEHDLGN